MNVLVIIQTMIKLFIMLALGFILNKTGVFDTYTNKKMSSLIVNVTSPLLVISSISSVTDSDTGLVMIMILGGFAMYIGFVILGKLVCRLLPIPEEDRPLYESMCVFANTGFMGVPVLLSLFDQQSIFYSSMIHFAFSMFIYTYGIITIQKGKGDYKFSFKSLITPGFILCIVALLIYCLNIHLPALIVDTCSSIGAITSPLSMMIIGSSLACYPLKQSLSDYRSYLFAVIRLLVIPAASYYICLLLNIPEYFRGIIVVINGMPVASMVLMLATQFDANTEVATKNIVVTTLLSMITIPVVVALFL